MSEEEITEKKQGYKDREDEHLGAKDGAEKGTEEPSKPKVYIHTDLVAVEPNIMDQFRTHSQIWSLFCLTVDEASKPDETFMQSEPMINVIKGGGGSQNIKEGRRATTLTEDTFGRVEYYIDNVRIESVLQPGGMGSRMPAVHTFNFEVTDLYISSSSFNIFI